VVSTLTTPNNVNSGCFHAVGAVSALEDEYIYNSVALCIITVRGVGQHWTLLSSFSSTWRSDGA